MRECRTYGSERGATGNGRPYRDLRSAHVKVFGCRPHDGRATRTGGRRTKTSNGGNRGKEGTDRVAIRDLGRL
jgi:hypothetical protein